MDGEVEMRVLSIDVLVGVCFVLTVRLDGWRERECVCVCKSLAKTQPHPGIIPAALNRSNALNHDAFGSISSSNPTPFTFSKLICRSNVK